MIEYPEISVVMPVHNGSKFLRRSLESIVEQTFSDFELLVIDDGSTDETPDIIEEFRRRDRRIRLLTHRRNRGLITSLNRGLQQARGSLIARQDADDTSERRRLELQRQAFLRDRRLGVLGSAYYRVRDNGDEVLRVPPVTHTKLRWRLVFENVWCHSTIMLRADVLPVNRTAYRDFLHAEDFELWGRLLQSTRGATLPEPLVHYREHGDAVSAVNLASQREMVARVSGLRMGELLGARLSRSVVQAVRDCWQGRETGTVEADVPVALLLEMFRRFERQPDVDRREVRRLKSRWVRRLVRRSGISWASQSGGRRAFRRILRRAPIALALAGLTRFLGR